MAPTPKALLLLAGLVLGLLAMAVVVALHAAWLARRQVIERETVGRSPVTYVPLPMDVRVREAGPNLSAGDKETGSATPWFTAAVLIAAGIAGMVLLPAKWAMVTIPTAVMAPSLSPGDLVLVDLHRAKLPPRRGEIVLLPSGDETQPFLVRRVIGLPGDRLVLRRMSLLLNGNRILPEQTAEQFEVDGVPRPVWRLKLPTLDPFPILPDILSVMADEPRLIIVESGQIFVMRDDRISPIATSGAVSGVSWTQDVQSTVTTILSKQNGSAFLQRL